MGNFHYDIDDIFFFQASSFQLLKLENLLRWSFFTFIYNRSSNMNYFIYILHIICIDVIEEIYFSSLENEYFPRNNFFAKWEMKSRQTGRR